MQWEKLGIIYTPDGSIDWAQSHAMLPVPFRLDAQHVRVFITCCDSHGRGRPGYIDVLSEAPTKVVRVGAYPLLELGAAGTFDENGVAACSVVRMPDNRLFMYYVGFELGVNIRYRLFTGLAISYDNGNSFQKYAQIPVLDRTDKELFFRCGPWANVLDNTVHLWYVAGSDWITVDGKNMPVYDIRYSRSEDGILWPEQGEVQIALTGDDEYGLGRPCVIKKNGGFRMFYSVRKTSVNAYRLGYAESDDGVSWSRMDSTLNLDVSPSGFDSEAIMYAAPIQLGDELYLFYNGNEFGRSGVAVAKLGAEKA